MLPSATGRSVSASPCWCHRLVVRNKIDTHTKYCTITHGYTIIIRNMLENASRAMTARKGGFNSDQCVGARPT
ncbi:unnamed protein product, partial [Nesidiocoris tenuis]